MTQFGTSIENDNKDIQFRISLIKEIYTSEFGSDSDLLNDILTDITELYQGKWDSHQSCQTGYHNLGHALDVALLTARMIGGWNRLDGQDHPRIGTNLFLAAIQPPMDQFRIQHASFDVADSNTESFSFRYSATYQDRISRNTHVFS